MWSMVSELHLDVPGVDYVAYTQENLQRLLVLYGIPGKQAGWLVLAVRRTAAGFGTFALPEKEPVHDTADPKPLTRS